MKKTTLAFVLLMASMTVTAEAGPFNLTGTLQGITVLDPGAVVDGGARNLVFKSTLTGDLMGEAVVVFNERPNGNRSQMWGSFVLRVTVNGQAGAYVGTYTGTIANGILDYRLSGEGTGGLSGTRLIYRGRGPGLLQGGVQPYTAKIVPQ